MVAFLQAAVTSGASTGGNDGCNRATERLIVPETGENRRFSYFIALTYKRAEPSYQPHPDAVWRSTRQGRFRVIGFLLGFVLFLVVVAGAVMFGQALVSDFDDVVPEDDEGE